MGGAKPSTPVNEKGHIDVPFVCVSSPQLYMFHLAHIKDTVRIVPAEFARPGDDEREVMLNTITGVLNEKYPNKERQPAVHAANKARAVAVPTLLPRRGR